MKIRHILIAGVALAASPAIAQDTVTPQAGADCATLQSQYDQAAATASAEQLDTAKTARDEGERLCAAGNTAEGTAKLQEAIDAISQSPQQQPMDPQPMEQPQTEQPPTDVETPPEA
jgi:hypothetical protein